MHLDGMAGLQRALARAPELARTHLEGAIATSTYAIAARAQAIAPVDQGVLRRAIYGERRGLTGRVLVGVDAFYWHFLEYGTVKLQAQPIFRPAAEQEFPVFEQRLRQIGSRLERDFSQGRSL